MGVLCPAAAVSGAQEAVESAPFVDATVQAVPIAPVVGSEQAAASLPLGMAELDRLPDAAAEPPPAPDLSTQYFPPSVPAGISARL